MTGPELTAEILAAVAPIVDGQPTELVIEAMAAAMMAAFVRGCPTPADRREILRRYAERITRFAAVVA